MNNFRTLEFKLQNYWLVIKQLAGTNTKPLSTTIHKADSSPCQCETETLERWREHFEAALNHPAGTPSPDLDAEAENAAADIDFHR